jgi:hypothetical protein
VYTETASSPRGSRVTFALELFVFSFLADHSHIPAESSPIHCSARSQE